MKKLILLSFLFSIFIGLPQSRNLKEVCSSYSSGEGNYIVTESEEENHIVGAMVNGTYYDYDGKNDNSFISLQNVDTQTFDIQFVDKKGNKSSKETYSLEKVLPFESYDTTLATLKKLEQ
ncbi:MAG: hypothetical protein RSF82_06980 [Angelakisella sp.]